MPFLKFENYFLLNCDLSCPDLSCWPPFGPHARKNCKNLHSIPLPYIDNPAALHYHGVW